MTQGAANANVIPGGPLNSAMVPGASIGDSMFCGRFLNAVALVPPPGPPGAGTPNDGTVCSRVTPFTLGVRFDDREATGLTNLFGTGALAASAAAMEALFEASSTQMAVGGAMVPSEALGTAGFSLGFQQFAC